MIMVLCSLPFPARAGACPLTRFRLQKHVRSASESAVETERAGFRGAPEEAEMAEALCCEYLSANPIHIQLWQREDVRWIQDLVCNLCAKFGKPNPMEKENRCSEILGGGAD